MCESHSSYQSPPPPALKNAPSPAGSPAVPARWSGAFLSNLGWICSSRELVRLAGVEPATLGIEVLPANPPPQLRFHEAILSALYPDDQAIQGRDPAPFREDRQRVDLD